MIIFSKLPMWLLEQHQFIPPHQCRPINSLNIILIFFLLFCWLNPSVHAFTTSTALQAPRPPYHNQQQPPINQSSNQFYSYRIGKHLLICVRMKPYTNGQRLNHHKKTNIVKLRPIDHYCHSIYSFYFFLYFQFVFRTIYIIEYIELTIPVFVWCDAVQYLTNWTIPKIMFSDQHAQTSTKKCILLTWEYSKQENIKPSD